MKTLALIACVAVALVAAAGANPLSPADREALLDSLDKLKESAEGRVESRYRTAITAYRSALASEDAAVEFYVKCIEKLNFTDQNRKASEFRDWKRRESARLSSPGFRLALRCQLQWLILYLRSSLESADIPALAAEAQPVINSLFDDPARLRAAEPHLRQSVTGTVFARTYEIRATDRTRWPDNPIQLERFYEQIVFPLYRSPARIDSLRGAWTNRLRQEAVRAAAADEGGRDGSAAERFNSETLPELQWQMEVDLFRAGDQAGAARRMLDHISNNITHRSARDWGEQFRALLTPGAPASPAPGT